jgi:phosphate transport system ATP-binding protein
LSQRPDVLCLDEFSIAVDPVTTMTIEDVLSGLKERMTIVIATTLVQQAQRLADHVLFLNGGAVVEAGPTDVVFSEHPVSPVTFDYVRGRFG